MEIKELAQILAVGLAGIGKKPELLEIVDDVMGSLKSYLLEEAISEECKPSEVLEARWDRLFALNESQGGTGVEPLTVDELNDDLVRLRKKRIAELSAACSSLTSDRRIGRQPLGEGFPHPKAPAVAGVKKLIEENKQLRIWSRMSERGTNLCLIEASMASYLGDASGCADALNWVVQKLKDECDSLANTLGRASVSGSEKIRNQLFSSGNLMGSAMVMAAENQREPSEKLKLAQKALKHMNDLCVDQEVFDRSLFAFNIPDHPASAAWTVYVESLILNNEIDLVEQFLSGADTYRFPRYLRVEDKVKIMTDSALWAKGSARGSKICDRFRRSVIDVVYYQAEPGIAAKIYKYFLVKKDDKAFRAARLVALLILLFWFGFGSNDASSNEKEENQAKAVAVLSDALNQPEVIVQLKANNLNADNVLEEGRGMIDKWYDVGNALGDDVSRSKYPPLEGVGVAQGFGTSAEDMEEQDIDGSSANCVKRLDILQILSFLCRPEI